MEVNAQWLRSGDVGPPFSFACLDLAIRGTVLSIVGMRLRVLQERRFFDAPVLCVHLDAFATDGLNRDHLLVVDELIDGGFDEAHCPLAFLLVAFLEPGVGLDRPVGRFVG